MPHTLPNLIDYCARTLCAHVVDHNIGAEPCVHEGIRTTETSAGTRNNDSFTVKTDFRRGLYIGGKLLGNFESFLATIA